MKARQPLLLRSLTIAYIAAFLCSLLWNSLASPSGHTICLLFHALLALLGGNVCLLRLKDVPAQEISWPIVLPCAALIMGVFVNIALHVLLH